MSNSRGCWLGAGCLLALLLASGCGKDGGSRDATGGMAGVPGATGGAAGVPSVSTGGTEATGGVGGSTSGGVGPTGGAAGALPGTGGSEASGGTAGAAAGGGAGAGVSGAPGSTGGGAGEPAGIGGMTGGAGTGGVIVATGGAAGSGAVSVGGGAGVGNEVRVVGAAEKGPFVLGSSVAVSVLRPALTPTGAVYYSEIESNAGDFAVVVPGVAPLRVQATGFYYNESSGGLSAAAITLRALFIPSEPGSQSVYVNLVTHLTVKRIEKLVGDGVDFPAAVAQAEEELRTELLITEPDFAPSLAGTALHMTGGDTDDNAYLFALSAVLANGRTDAELQELINTLSTDLQAAGALNPSVVATIQSEMLGLDTQRIIADFSARLVAIGSTAVAPDIDRVLDQDLDELANAYDNCPLLPNPLQEDADGDDLGDVCDPCPATDCGMLGCIPDDAAVPTTGTCAPLCTLPEDGDPEGSPDCVAGMTCRSVPWVPAEVGPPAEPAKTGLLCVNGCDVLVSSSCGADGACVSVSEGASYDWVCAPRNPALGPGSEGTPCDGEAQVPGVCAAGLVCVGPVGAATCRVPCDQNLAHDARCGDNHACVASGDASFASSSAVGAAGVCALAACGAGLTACGADCVNLDSAQSDCGFCGNACAANQACTSGTCTPCPYRCNGVCVDLNTSNTNCGACGAACGTGKNCVGGACM